MKTQEGVKIQGQWSGNSPQTFSFPSTKRQPLRNLFNVLTPGKNLACVQPPPQNFFFSKRVSEVVMEMIQGPVPERPISANK